MTELFNTSSINDVLTAPQTGDIILIVTAVAVVALVVIFIIMKQKRT